MIGRQVGATDMWSDLLVVIMDGEDAQGAAGWTGVLNPGGMIVRPAEDALQMMYMAGRYHGAPFVSGCIGDEGDASVPSPHPRLPRPYGLWGLMDYFEFDSG